MMGSLHGN
jgi:hypothetical protein